MYKILFNTTLHYEYLMSFQVSIQYNKYCRLASGLHRWVLYTFLSMPVIYIPEQRGHPQKFDEDGGPGHHHNHASASHAHHPPGHLVG